MKARRISTWMLAAVLVAASSVGAAAGPPTRPSSRPTQFTVATYNIRYALEDPRDLAEAAKVIRQADADVVAIQESSQPMQDFLRKELAKDYPFIQFYFVPAGGSFGWLSRYPLEDARLMPRKAGVGLFDVPVARIKLGEATVQLVGVHLTPVWLPPTDGWRATLQRVAATDDARAKEVQYIWSQVPTDGPLVVLGDFNSPSFMAAQGILAGRGLVDSFASVTKGADETPTWSSQIDNLRYAYRIDYIFHNRHFKTQASRIIAAGPSDHYMVVSQIELVSGPPTKP